MDASQAKLQAFASTANKNSKVNLQADDTDLKRKVDSSKNALDAYARAARATPQAKFTADASSVQRAGQTGQQAISNYNREVRNVQVAALRGDATGAVLAAERAKQAFDKIPKEVRSTIRVTETGAAATKQKVDAVTSAARQADGKSAKITITESGGGATKVVIEDIDRAAGGLDGRNVTIHINESGAATTKAAITGVNDEVDRTNRTPLNLRLGDTSIIGQLTQVRTNIVQLSAALRALGLIAVVSAIPALVASISGLIGVAGAAASGVLGLGSAISVGLVGAAAAGASAVGLLAGAFGLVAGPASALIGKIGDYSKSLDTTSGSQSSAASSARGLESAQRGVESAATALEDAQRGVSDATEKHTQAQEDLNRALRDEPLEQWDAALTAQEAELGVAEATQRAAEAQDKYNEAVASGDPKEIARATLDIQRATLGQERASLTAERASRAYYDTSTEGSQNLQSAQEGEKQAAKGVEDAIRRQEEAGKALTDAQRQVALAAEQMAQSQAAAAGKTIALSEAQQMLADKFIAFRQLSRDLFGPAEDEAAAIGVRILDLASNLMPMFADASLRATQAAGVGFDDFAAKLQQPIPMDALQTILDSMVSVTGTATIAAGELGIALITTFSRATPYGEALIGIIAENINKFYEWTQTAEGLSTIDSVLAKIWDSASRLVGVISNLGIGFWNLIDSVNQAGITEQMFSGLERFAQMFRDATTAGTDTRKMIDDFNVAAGPILTSLGGVAGEFAKQILLIAQHAATLTDSDGMPLLASILDDIKEALPTVAEGFKTMFEHIGPELGPTIKNIAEAFELLARNSGNIVAVIEGVNGLFDAFQLLPDDLQDRVVQLLFFGSAIRILTGLSYGTIVTGLYNLGSTLAGWAFSSKAAELDAVGESIDRNITTEKTGRISAFTSALSGLAAIGAIIVAVDAVVHWDGAAASQAKADAEAQGKDAGAAMSAGIVAGTADAPIAGPLIEWLDAQFTKVDEWLKENDPTAGWLDLEPPKLETEDLDPTGGTGTGVMPLPTGGTVPVASADQTRTDGNTAGKAWIDGFFEGLGSIWEKTKESYEAWKVAVEEFFGIASPSTLAMGWATSIVEGFIQGLIAFPGRVMEILTQLGASIATWALELPANVSAGLQQLPTLFGTTWSEISSGAYQFFNNLSTQIFGVSLDAIWARVSGWGAILRDQGFIALFTEIGTWLLETLTGWIEGTFGVNLDAIWERVSGWLTTLRDEGFIAFITEIGTYLYDTFSGWIENTFGVNLDAIWTRVSGWLTTLRDEGFIAFITEIGQWLYDTLAGWIENTFGVNLDAIYARATGFLTTLRDEGFIAFITEIGQWLYDTINGWVENTFGVSFDAIIQRASDFGTAFTDTLSTAVGGAVQAALGWMADLVSGVADVLDVIGASEGAQKARDTANSLRNTGAQAAGQTNSPGSRALGGPDPGNMAAMASGGSRGGQGTYSNQAQLIEWNEQHGREWWIATSGPRRANERYLAGAARDMGYGLMPMAKGGQLPVYRQMAIGGGTDVGPEGLSGRARELAFEEMDKWGVWTNTYVGGEFPHGSLHGNTPENTWDTWNDSGFGALDIPTGDAILSWLYDTAGSELDTVIWQGWGEGPGGSFPDEGHYDHLHASVGGGGLSGAPGAIAGRLLQMAKAIWEPIAEKLGTLDIGTGTFADSIDTFLQTLLPQAWNYILSLVPRGTGGFSGGQLSGDIESMLSQAIEWAGWTPEDLAALKTLWGNESGFDPNIVNPESGAYGIPQINPASHGYPAPIGDAAAQIAWGIDYIKNHTQFSTPSEALDFWYANGYYAKGGSTDMLPMAGGGKISSPSSSQTITGSGPKVQISETKNTGKKVGPGSYHVGGKQTFSANQRVSQNIGTGAANAVKAVGGNRREQNAAASGAMNAVGGSGGSGGRSSFSGSNSGNRTLNKQFSSPGHYANVQLYSNQKNQIGRYHSGGVIPGSRGEDRMVWARAGERVLDDQETQLFGKMVDRLPDANLDLPSFGGSDQGGGPSNADVVAAIEKLQGAVVGAVLSDTQLSKETVEALARLLPSGESTIGPAARRAFETAQYEQSREENFAGF